MDTRRKRKPFTVDLTLTPEHLAEYMTVLADRRTTLVMAIAWLKARGYARLSWGAVYRHRRRFLDEEAERRAYGLTDEYLRELRAAGDEHAVMDAVLANYENALFHRMSKKPAGGKRQAARELEAWGKAVSWAVQARERHTCVRREHAAEARRAARRAARAAPKRADGEIPAVSPAALARVREILGLPPESA